MEKVYKVLKFDFLSCWRTIAFLIGFFFVFGFYYAFTVRDLLVIPVSIMFWFSMLAGLPFSWREKYGLDNLIATFPVSRRAIIRSRYLFALFIGVIGISASEILVCINSGVFAIGFNIREMYFALCATFLIYCLIIAVHMPLYFRLSHAVVIQLSPVFIYFLYIIGYQLYFYGVLDIDFGPVIDFTWKFSIPVLTGILFAAAAVLLSSYAAACRLYINKDL